MLSCILLHKWIFAQFFSKLHNIFFRLLCFTAYASMSSFKFTKFLWTECRDWNTFIIARGNRLTTDTYCLLKMVPLANVKVFQSLYFVQMTFVILKKGIDAYAVKQRSLRKILCSLEKDCENSIDDEKFPWSNLKKEKNFLANSAKNPLGAVVSFSANFSGTVCSHPMWKRTIFNTTFVSEGRNYKFVPLRTNYAFSLDTVRERHQCIISAMQNSQLFWTQKLLRPKHHAWILFLKWQGWNR